jgi:hypothetical protein
MRMTKKNERRTTVDVRETRGVAPVAVVGEGGNENKRRLRRALHWIDVSA